MDTPEPIPMRFAALFWVCLVVGCCLLWGCVYAAARGVTLLAKEIFY